MKVPCLRGCGQYRRHGVRGDPSASLPDMRRACGRGGTVRSQSGLAAPPFPLPRADEAVDTNHGWPSVCHRPGGRCGVVGAAEQRHTSFPLLHHESRGDGGLRKQPWCSGEGKGRASAEASIRHRRVEGDRDVVSRACNACGDPSCNLCGLGASVQAVRAVCGAGRAGGEVDWGSQEVQTPAIGPVASLDDVVAHREQNCSIAT